MPNSMLPTISQLTEMLTPSTASKQEVEDMFNFLVHKGYINIKEFEDFKENCRLIEKIN